MERNWAGTMVDAGEIVDQILASLHQLKLLIYILPQAEQALVDFERSGDIRHMDHFMELIGGSLAPR